MLTDADRQVSRAGAEHFEREIREYQRQSAEVAQVLVHRRADSSAANRAVRLSDEYVRLRRAIRDGDTTYHFPLVGDEALGAVPTPRAKPPTRVAAAPPPAAPAQDRKSDSAGNFGDPF